MNECTEQPQELDFSLIFISEQEEHWGAVYWLATLTKPNQTKPDKENTEKGKQDEDDKKWQLL